MTDLSGGPAEDDSNAVPPDPGAARVRISVLGPLSVEVAGRAVLLGAYQQRRLVALLSAAATERRSVSTEQITDALSHGRSGQRARSTTATALWRLRQAIGPDAVLADAGEYALDLAICAIDAVEFEALLDDGQRLLLAGQAGDSAEQLRHAIDLWRGEPLADLADHPEGRAATSRLTELRLGATEDLAEALIATGRREEAARALEALTTQHPAREHAWALLVECYRLAGEQRRARQAYDTAARHLAEHGLEPGAELSATRPGLDDTVTGAPSSSSFPALPPQAPSRQRRPVALVGRDRERDALLDVVRTGLQGRETRLTVVAGEAGVGKTTLLAAATATLEAEGIAVTRAAGDLRVELPYAIVTSLLGGLGPDGATASGPLAQLTSTLSGDGEAEDVVTDKQTLCDAIAERLETAAASHPAGVVVVIDDVHWATPASLEALLHVMARRATVPLALVVAIRQPAKTADGVAALLAEVRRRATLLVELAGLDEAAVGLLLGEVDADTAAWAHEVSGGNPLYVTQLANLDLASLRGDRPVRLPATLDDAIAARLAMLPDEAVAVLRLAAVAGPTFDARVVTAAAAKLSSISANEVVDALRAGVVAGVVVAENGASASYRFAHTLTAKHLYFALPADQRCRAHVAVGEALERVTAAETPPIALLAHHFASGWPACPAEVAAEYLRTAGDRSAAQLDFGRGGEFYARALDLLALEPGGPTSPRLERDLLARAGDSATFDDDLPTARATYARLSSVARRDGDLNDRLRAAAGILGTFSAERVDPRAVDALSVVLDDVAVDPTAVDPALLADAISSLYRYRPEPAGRLAEHVLATPHLEATVLPGLWDQQSVEDQARTAERLTQSDHVDPHRAWARTWVSEIATGKGSFAHPPPAPTVAPRGNDARWEQTLMRTLVATATGDLPRAERLITAAWNALHAPGNTDPTSRYATSLMGQASWLAASRGEWNMMLASLGGIGRTWSMHHPIQRATRMYRDAVMARDRTAVTAACDDLVDELLDGDMPAGNFLTRTMMLAHACIWCDNQRGIAACREALTPASGQHAFFYLTMYGGAVNGNLGRLAAAAGDMDAAVGYMEMAIDDYRSVASPIYLQNAQAALDAALTGQNHFIGRDR